MIETEVKPLPKHVLLAQKIKTDINLGRLAAGDQLPSFTELQREYGATTTTVERVLSTLERDGLVERKRGKGTFVRVRTSKSPGASTSSAILANSVAVLNMAALDNRIAPPPGSAEAIAAAVLDRLREFSLHSLAINNISSVSAVVADLAEIRPFGLILPEAHGRPEIQLQTVRAVAAEGIPAVAYRAGAELADIDRVISDYEGGSYELTRWLIARGRRRIVNLWPPSANAFWYEPRFAGYKRAMEEAGLEAVPPIIAPYIVTHLPSPAEFQESLRNVAGRMAEYLTGANPIDAIMAIADGYIPETAAMLKLFHKAPNVDVDMVGYDNNWADMDSPFVPKALPLATIDKSNAVIGASLVDLLMDRRNGRLEAGPVQRLVSQRLVEVPLLGSGQLA